MPDKQHRGLRKFNRNIFNPIIKLFAGRLFYSVVYYIGRRSGKEYSTPVVSRRENEFVFIPLPYRVNTDWLLNVQAKGSCLVMISAKLYPSTNPEVVDPTAASIAFSRTLQKAFRRANITQYLRLRIE